MLRVNIIERADGLPAIAPLWQKLYEQSRERTLFQTYELNEIAARTFAERERPHVVVVESDSAAAIVPACVRDDRISLLGEELFDYRAPLFNDRKALETAWAELERMPLPIRVKATRGRVEWAETRPFAGAPFLPASARLPVNKKLERNLRLLRERGCVLRFNESSKEPHYREWVRRMYELKARTENGSLFTDGVRVRAVVEMSVALPSELFTIEREGEIVSAILTFIDGSTCRFYATGYDDRWKRFSPGASLLYEVVRRAQSRGMDFDFMTGEQSYKMRFATQVVPLYIAERLVQPAEMVRAA